MITCVQFSYFSILKTMPKEQAEEKVLFKYEGRDILQEYDMPDYFYDIIKEKILFIIKKLKINYKFEKFDDENLKNFSTYCENKISVKKHDTLKSFTKKLNNYIWAKWEMENALLPEISDSFAYDLARKKVYRFKNKPSFLEKILCE